MNTSFNCLSLYCDKLVTEISPMNFGMLEFLHGSSLDKVMPRNH